MKIYGIEFKDVNNELPKNGSKVLIAREALGGYAITHCLYDNYFHIDGIPLLFVEFWVYDKQ